MAIYLLTGNLPVVDTETGEAVAVADVSINFEIKTEPPFVESLNGTEVPIVNQITDHEGHLWTLSATDIQPGGPAILRDGVQWGSGAAPYLLYWERLIYAKAGAQESWYVTDGTDDTQVWTSVPGGDPRPTPPAPVIFVPNPPIVNFEQGLPARVGIRQFVLPAPTVPDPITLTVVTPFDAADAAKGLSLDESTMEVLYSGADVGAAEGADVVTQTALTIRASDGKSGVVTFRFSIGG